MIFCFLIWQTAANLIPFLSFRSEKEVSEEPIDQDFVMLDAEDESEKLQSISDIFAFEGSKMGRSNF